MTSQPTGTNWLDVHAHHVADHCAEACRAAGHGRPDGMRGLPDRSSAEPRRAPEPQRARLDLGPEAPASVPFPRLPSATKGSP